MKIWRKYSSNETKQGESPCGVIEKKEKCSVSTQTGEGKSVTRQGEG